jgi:hypothetical protein
MVKAVMVEGLAKHEKEHRQRRRKKGRKEGSELRKAEASHKQVGMG